MLDPIVSWYNSTNNAEVASWNLKTVDAGATSTDFTVLVWNNRAGANPGADANLEVKDMQNIFITVKDKDGGNTGEIINTVPPWIQVKNNTLNEATFTPIGGTTTKAIRSNGSTVNASGTFTPGVSPHIIDVEFGTVDLLGTWNDGSIANAKGNFIQLTLHAVVPALASSGTVNFLTRLTYQYA